MSNLSFVASPKSARISMNNLQRVCAGYGVNPVLSNNDGLMIKKLGSFGSSELHLLETTGESKMLKTTDNVKLFTAEEMAQKLGISMSYVYAKLSKLEASPAHKEGKTAYYSESTLNKMQGRVRRQRRTIPDNAVTNFKSLSKEYLDIQPKSQESTLHPESLLERMTKLEKKLEKFEAIEKSLEEIKRILGTL